MRPNPNVIVDMSKILDKDPLFIFVFNILLPNRDIDFDHKINLVHKICNKLIKYGHDKKSSDFKEMYVRYYISGYLNFYDFDKIVSDGTFHMLGFTESKDLFLEVYYGNRYLIQKFSEEFQFSPFSSDSARSNYVSWLTKNFSYYYNLYHKEIETDKFKV